MTLFLKASFLFSSVNSECLKSAGKADVGPVPGSTYLGFPLVNVCVVNPGSKTTDFAFPAFACGLHFCRLWNVATDGRNPLRTTEEKLWNDSIPQRKYQEALCFHSHGFISRCERMSCRHPQHVSRNPFERGISSLCGMRKVPGTGR